MGLRSILIALFAICLSGCYSNYTGIYSLNRTESAQVDDLTSCVAEALKPFGFRVGPAESFGPGMSNLFHNPKFIDSELIELSGVGARLGVMICHPPHASITLRDWDNAQETEFVRALKEALEKALKENYKIDGLRFKRKPDFFT